MSEQKPDINAITLNSAQKGGREQFNGLLLEGTGSRHVAVILLHGRKLHPDGPVTGQLRRSLWRLGYSTLSIQNPVPTANDEFPDYVQDINGKNYVFPEAYARVRTAIAHMKQLGAREVVLLGFSMGARMHSAFLAKGEATELPVVGLIALSNGVNGIPPLNAAASLNGIALPVLDVSAGGDPDVEKSLELRKAAYQAGGGTAFTGFIVKGAVPHDFAGSEQELQRLVHSWIATVAPANP